MSRGDFINKWAWMARGPIDRAYKPEKDPVFLKECAEELQRWRDWRDGKIAITTPQPQPPKDYFDFMLDENETPEIPATKEYVDAE